MCPEEDNEQVALLWCWRNVGSLLWERKYAVLSLKQRSCQKEMTRDDNAEGGNGGVCGVDGAEDGRSTDFVFFSLPAPPMATTGRKVVGGGECAIVIR